MTRFAEWCNQVQVPSAANKLETFTADPTKIANAIKIVAEVVPEHYINPGRLSDLFKRLGRNAVSKYVQEKMPTTIQIKSGDLGEILCTTFVNESTPFNLGIKRLRWKDHRNMSMRGDDVLAFNIQHGAAGLRILKAESKSAIKIQASTIAKARQALSEYGELPSPHALSFVADRLDELSDKPLRDALDDAQLKSSLKPSQVTHLLFTFTGNDATSLLAANLNTYAGKSPQHYVGLRVEKHQEFINLVFAAVGS